jgi:N-acetylmuramoyl-L-alanine amidase
MNCDNRGGGRQISAKRRRARWVVGCVALLLTALTMPQAMSAPNDKKTEAEKKIAKAKSSHANVPSHTTVKSGAASKGDAPGQQVQAAPAGSTDDATTAPKPPEAPAAPQPDASTASPTPTAASAPTPAASGGANQPQPSAQQASPTPAEIIRDRSQGLPYPAPQPAVSPKPATPPAATAPAEADKAPVAGGASSPTNEASPPANATEVRPPASAGEGAPAITAPAPATSQETVEPTTPATPVPSPSQEQAPPAAQPPAAACNRAEFRVAIDVGHTETNYGAVSAHGKPEYEFNLRLASELLVKLFDADFQRSTIVIQTDSDLQKRARDLSSRRPNLMLSLHHDSVQDKYLKHAELDGQMRTFTEGFRGYSIFISHENAYLDDSEKFAHLLGSEMMANGLKPTFHHHEQENRPIYDPVTGIFFYDGLVVLHSTTAPAVLLESAVITNPEDEQKANDKAYRNRITNAIVAAVIRYCEASSVRAQPRAAPPQAAEKPAPSDRQGSRK